MIQRLVILLLFLLSTGIAFAVEKTPSDSLKQAYFKATNDSIRIQLLFELAELEIGNNNEQAQLYISTAKKLNTDPNSKTAARVYYWQGRLYEAESKFDLSLEAFIAANKIFTTLNDKKGMAQTANSIGVSYWYQEIYPKAKEYLDLAIKINLQIKDDEGVASNYGNLALMYNEMGSTDTSLIMFENALQAFKLLHDDWSVATCYDNMGLIESEAGKHEEALKHLFMAKKIREEIGDASGVIASLNNIGYAYYLKKESALAIPYLEESRKRAHEEKMGYDEKLALLNLANSYALQGNYKEAFDYYKKYSNLRDSLFGEEKNKKMLDLEAQYKNEQQGRLIEKMEKQKALSDLDNEARENKNRLVKYSLIAGLIILVLIACLFIIRFLEKKKANLLLQDKNIEIMSQKDIIEEKNKDIFDSISYAKTIQQSILPGEKNFENYFKEAFVLYRPRDIVSGDFYWIADKKINLSEDIVFAIADCTGHGVPGALMSMVGNNLLDRIINDQQITDPGDILNRLHKNIRKVLKQDTEAEHAKDGMDIVVCCWKKSTGELHYASAQRPSYLVRDGVVEELKNQKIAVGGRTEKELYKTESVSIRSGDVLYLLTDGFTDQFGKESGKKFLSKRFRELLPSISAQKIQDQKVSLDNVLNNWMKDVNQVDDITVIGIRF